MALALWHIAVEGQAQACAARQGAVLPGVCPAWLQGQGHGGGPRRSASGRHGPVFRPGQSGELMRELPQSQDRQRDGRPGQKGAIFSAENIAGGGKAWARVCAGTCRRGSLRPPPGERKFRPSGARPHGLLGAKDFPHGDFRVGIQNEAGVPPDRIFRTGQGSSQAGYLASGCIGAQIGQQPGNLGREPGRLFWEVLEEKKRGRRGLR